MRSLTPRLLYVHDYLGEEIGRCLGPPSGAAALARRLVEVLARRRGTREESDAIRSRSIAWSPRARTRPSTWP